MSTETGTPRRPDASMTLLTEMLQRPLDPGYAAAAAARRAHGLPASTGLRSWRLGVALLGAGLLFGIAAVTLGPGATTRSNARADLIAQIEAGRLQAEQKSEQIATLNADLAARDVSALRAEPGRQVSQLRELSVVTGASAVEGPGLVITVDDAPASGDAASKTDPRAGARAQDGIVRARDLQIITNSLWATGAEAMMINGQRLTSTTAIRFAGEALIVNYRPLTRPYVITAIGDPGSFPARFAGGEGGSYLSTLKASFGIQEHIDTVANVTLPASAAVQTRVAAPLLESPSSSPSTSTGSLTPSPPTSSAPAPGGSP